MYGYVYAALCGLLVINVVCSQSTESCIKQINSCACETASGYINLEKLDQAKQNGQPKWSNQPDSAYPSTTYAYNPCTAFTSGGCSSVAGCQFQSGIGYAIGTQDTASFQTDVTLGTILQYTTIEGRTLKVQLVCDTSQEGLLSNVGEDPSSQGTYHMTLTTKYACAAIAPPPGGKGGGGGGSGGFNHGYHLIIVFLVCLLVAGLLFCKRHKGNQGKEVVRNVDVIVVPIVLPKDDDMEKCGRAWRQDVQLHGHLGGHHLTPVTYNKAG